jgi:hypothetical protein
MAQRLRLLRMSDQALVWKLAFGALVLVFCAVAYVGRKDAQPSAAASHAPVPAPARPIPVPGSESEPSPPANLPPAAPEAAALRQAPEPSDAPETQETPVRIHVSLADPPAREQRPVAARVRHHGRHALAPRLHFVRATHSRAGRARHASPYAIGRLHYPFDPRQRWRTRDG